jgi:hypothetical protein
LKQENAWTTPLEDMPWYPREDVAVEAQSLIRDIRTQRISRNVWNW